MNLTEKIDLFETQTTRESRSAAPSLTDSPLDAARVTLRDIAACLRAVGTVALGVAALSRELREWERLRCGRRMRQAAHESRKDFHPDHA